MKCSHRGFEYVHRKVRRNGKIVRLLWRCAFCRKRLKGRPRENKNQRIVREFRGGLSVVGLARKHGVTMKRVEAAFREALH